MSILGHKVSTDALLLALASVVVIVFLYRKQAGAGAPAGAAVPIYDQSGNGFAFAPAPVNGSIASTPPASTGTPDTPINTADWVRQGAGFTYAPHQNIIGAPDLVTEGGHTYYHIEQPAAESAILAGGGTVYFAPAPGQFVALGSGQPNPGTGVAGLPPGGTAIYGMVGP